MHDEIISLEISVKNLCSADWCGCLHQTLHKRCCIYLFILIHSGHREYICLLHEGSLKCSVCLLQSKPNSILHFSFHVVIQDALFPLCFLLPLVDGVIFQSALKFWITKYSSASLVNSPWPPRRGNKPLSSSWPSCHLTTINFVLNSSCSWYRPWMSGCLSSCIC